MFKKTESRPLPEKKALLALAKVKIGVPGMPSINTSGRKGGRDQGTEKFINISGCTKKENDPDPVRSVFYVLLTP